ncbi:2-hydroxyacid dehydrogenase [Thalassobaculum sp.]|uniref:2-hydroxyacid dehydrogenase n=1 Tax=Thalassobaculum sp. TaxID=2022740 RepID=UPI0032F080AE
MSEPRIRVFYNSFGSGDLYDLIAEAGGRKFELVFLDGDDDSERCSKIAECEAVICAAAPLRKRHIDAGTRLRIVHHQGVGWQDTTDWQEIRRRGLPLALTPEGTTIGVAEHTVLLMLAAAKRLPYADAELRHGRWHVNTLRGVSRELYGKTIGYVGMGRIAEAVADRLKRFGCAGIYADPGVELPAERACELGLRRGALDDVLRAADVLSIHVPLTEQTRGLIGRSALERLKPGAIVVNTARGGIVDEAALADGLISGHILAAGLDVFEVEPPAAGNPLFTLPNVVLTPHISAGTRDAMRQKMDALFTNLSRFFSTGTLHNQVRFP